MTDLSSLIERIEKSEGADRTLDFEILCLADPRAIQTGALPGDPRYTASMDAVRTLIDSADEWELTTIYGVALATVGLNRDHQTSWPGYGEHKGGDPVRALLSAALKARSQPHEG